MISNDQQMDLAVIGGGIVGLAAARELLARHPEAAVAVLEKEPAVAAHQTGHNSGVIHSGIYYRPGSIKARTCVVGARLMVDFCRSHDIPIAMCGKLIVATDESELPALNALHQRGMANGVPGLRVLGAEQLREIEPHARGIQALHVAGTGIVDYAAVARAFARQIEEAGGRIHTSTRVIRLIRRHGAWILETTKGAFSAKFLVTCGGLHSDRLAAMTGSPSALRIAPFRGEYYEVIPERRFLVKGMIYPVPNPALPFLGVHFTRSITGGVHAGPNAVLALKREGYRKTDIDLGDTLDLLLFPGFWRMARRYWGVGFAETYRSFSQAAFTRALARLVPDIRSRDLIPGGSGVRAQALDAQGTLLDDFDMATAEAAIHVRNVPSPAATASLAIGRTIADMADSAFGWHHPIPEHSSCGSS